eukprot:271202-Chlamydomonas_euryale.AAC.3
MHSATISSGIGSLGRPTYKCGIESTLLGLDAKGSSASVVAPAARHSTTQRSILLIWNMILHKSTAQHSATQRITRHPSTSQHITAQQALVGTCGGGIAVGRLRIDMHPPHTRCSLAGQHAVGWQQTLACQAPWLDGNRRWQTKHHGWMTTEVGKPGTVALTPTYYSIAARGFPAPSSQPPTALSHSGPAPAPPPFSPDSASTFSTRCRWPCGCGTRFLSATTSVAEPPPTCVSAASATLVQ